MTRLIDADALKENVNKKKVVGRFNTLCLIDNAPTVEPHPSYCNHIFNNYIRVADPKRMCITMHLKCMLCDGTISLNMTSGMIADLLNDITLNGLDPIYVKAVSNENPCDPIK